MCVLEKIRALGSQEYIANELGVKQSSVGAWLTKNPEKREKIPPKRAIQIEKKFNISASEIRPDFFNQ